VIGTVADELRTLGRVKTAMDSGQALSVALRDLRVWGARERLLPAAVQRLTRAQLVHAIRRCAALDKAAKGLPQAAQHENMTGEPWADLLALGLSLMPLR
jgi:DNA polymerase-3 subunit delta